MYVLACVNQKRSSIFWSLQNVTLCSLCKDYFSEDKTDTRIETSLTANWIDSLPVRFP